jgi:hypothetical protein
MSYAHLFENPANETELPPDIMIDVVALKPEQLAAVLAWIGMQADRKAAEARLRDVLRQALFDVTAAELGALLHKPGIS